MSEPRLLSNRYEIGGNLGYGGMSEVHRGRDIRLGRDVAVKVLRADLARDPTFQLRFRREAQNAAALNHPAIVAVYDTGETESDNGPLPYIVMEYVDGQTLRDIVKAEGPLPSRRAMEVMADASAALDFSHRHGIVHRDVKPANVMITESGAVKVMDFGIARAVADGQAAVTQTAAVIGTAQYLSPEQARGESVDARSDVYASGCVLFELVTGEPPFTGDSPVAVAYQHVREDPRKPSDVNTHVPASLDAVVLKALSKNPANRYQSAAEMRADLVRVLSGQRPKAPMIMSEEERTSMFAAGAATEVGRHRPEDDELAYEVEEERRRKRRKHWKAGLITALCVALLAGAGWAAAAFVPWGPQEEPVPAFKGQTVEQARSVGWRTKVEPCPSSPEDTNKVMWQDPPAGQQVVRSQTTITLCGGSGPTTVPVPDLYNQGLQDAKQVLRDSGLELNPDTKTQEVSDPSLDGKIVNWDHRQGGEVPRNTTITVTVGHMIPKVSIPPVENLPYATAESILKSSGFEVNKQVQPSEQPTDTVLKQDPSGNSSTRRGSEVTLTVSDGQQITMPSLEGKSKDEAEQALRQSGWSGSITEGPKEPTSELRKNNKVVNSTPAEGAKIRKDQTITINMGKYELTPTSSSSSSSGGGLFRPPFND